MALSQVPTKFEAIGCRCQMSVFVSTSKPFDQHHRNRTYANFSVDAVGHDGYGACGHDSGQGPASLQSAHSRVKASSIVPIFVEDSASNRLEEVIGFLPVYAGPSLSRFIFRLRVASCSHREMYHPCATIR